jgi:CheY-like chemotaxis protein
LLGLSILLVEDNTSSAESLQMLLLGWNARVRFAFGAEAALRLAQQAEAAGQGFGLIITDRLEGPKDALWMMDQIQICDQPNLRDIPVVILSSKRLDPSKIVSKSVNHVAKPVRRASLLEAIRATQESARTEEVSLRNEDLKGHATEQPEETILKILVVEDNPVNSLMAVRLLEKHGHKVWAASSGEEALTSFNSRPFDAILMDIQMADIDGFEVTRRIRQAEGSERRVRVIATTAHALDGDRERCLAAGMDDYLTKPLQFTELLSSLARATRQSTAPGSRHQTTPPVPLEVK